MHHLVIFLQIVSLIIGAGTILYLHQLNKSYQNYLIKVYKYFVIVFNINLLDEMVIKYIITNLTENNPEWINVYYIYFHNPVNLFLTIVLIYCFLKITFELIGKPVKRYMSIIFRTGVIILTLCLFTGIFFYIRDFSGQWLIRTNRSADNLFSAVVIISAFYLLIYKGTHGNSAKAKTVNVIAGFYLAVFIIPYFDLIISFGEFNHLFGILFLFMNIFPVIWTRKYYVKYFLIKDNTSENHKQKFDSLAKEYKISKRESEIIELIMQGKSNKEIEDLLFISFHTVKNHIYNLYQKFGLNSRAQLIHFINSKVINKD